MKRVVERQNEMMPVKSLEKSSTHSEYLVNISCFFIIITIIIIIYCAITRILLNLRGQN